jgi:cytochrome c oxidase cbb3-type subunit 2
MKWFDDLLDWFSKLTTPWESLSAKFTLFTVIAILIGGLFELVPPFFLAQTVPPISSVTPYSPLELAGRDIYQKEGCGNCHTQMIRPFTWEVERFGGAHYEVGYSQAGESVYEHPFLWGSKRTGPDLAHESQIQPSAEWHRTHMINPRETSPGSIMPAYPWLFENQLSASDIRDHMQGLKAVGVPYTQADFDSVETSVSGKTEGDAIIAYLLKLGRDTAKK